MIWYHLIPSDTSLGHVEGVDRPFYCYRKKKQRKEILIWMDCIHVFERKIYTRIIWQKLEIGFTIDELSFDEKDSELCKNIKMRNSDKQKNIPPENAQYFFWHPFIYICALHFLFHKDPEFVIKHCNVYAILQLVRPKRF